MHIQDVPICESGPRTEMFELALAPDRSEINEIIMEGLPPVTTAVYSDLYIQPTEDQTPPPDGGIR